MEDIFICYRRDDTRGDAGRLHDRLAAHFGAERVFMDVQDIRAGVEFDQALERTLAGCRVLIVMIGTRWRGSHPGEDRLSAPDDYVRQEIEHGLRRQLLVIPVLVGGAAIPSAESLPPDLAPLSRRQAFPIREERYDADVELLLGHIGSSGVAEAQNDAWQALRSVPKVVSVAEAKAMCVAKGMHAVDWNAASPGPPAAYEAAVHGTDIVVHHRSTGLEWEHGGWGQFRVFEKAMQRVAEFNDREFGGHRDWRLPTLEEAMSLLRPETYRNYHMDRAFDASAAPIMWTADETEDGGHWVVYFGNGYCRPEGAGYNAHTKVVRGAG